MARESSAAKLRVKRRLAESIRYEEVRAPIEEVFDDLAVKRLGGVQEQRRPLLVDDEIGLCDGVAVAYPPRADAEELLKRTIICG